MGSSAGVCVAVLLLRKVGPFSSVAFPLQKKPKLLPAFLFWRCTTVEPIIDRRERDPNEFCQSVPRQARFKLIFLQPFQKASAFSDPNRVFWPPNSHLHKHRRNQIASEQEIYLIIVN